MVLTVNRSYLSVIVVSRTVTCEQKISVSYHHSDMTVIANHVAYSETNWNGISGLFNRLTFGLTLPWSFLPQGIFLPTEMRHVKCAKKHSILTDVDLCKN